MATRSLRLAALASLELGSRRVEGQVVQGVLSYVRLVLDSEVICWTYEIVVWVQWVEGIREQRIGDSGRSIRQDDIDGWSLDTRR
jgi:hypothetical protein